MKFKKEYPENYIETTGIEIQIQAIINGRNCF